MSIGVSRLFFEISIQVFGLRSINRLQKPVQDEHPFNRGHLPGPLWQPALADRR